MDNVNDEMDRLLRQTQNTKINSRGNRKSEHIYRKKFYEEHPTKERSGPKAFHENFIKYLRRNFIKTFREQRKRECLTNHFMGRNTPTGTKRLQTISYPSQIDTEILYKTSTK